MAQTQQPEKAQIKPLILLCNDSSVRGVRPTQEDTHLGILDLHAHMVAKNGDSVPGQTSHTLGVPHRPSASSRAAPPSTSEEKSKSKHSGGWVGGYLSGGTGEVALFSVFDGHNGRAASEFCEEKMPSIISKYISPNGSITGGDLQLTFVDMDRTFLRASGMSAAGCTAVVSVLNTVSYTLTVGHVGDARCIVSRNGKAKVLTKVDHKPSVSSEAARITGAGLTVHNNRLDGKLAVSRAIGDRMFKQNAYPIAKVVKAKKKPEKPKGKFHHVTAKVDTGRRRYVPRRSRSSKRKKSVVNAGGIDMAAASRMALTAVPDTTSYQLNAVDRQEVGPDGDVGDQFILLACDGLFDVMSNQEAVDFVHQKAEYYNKLQCRRRRGGPAAASAGSMTASEYFDLMERQKAEEPMFSIADQLTQEALDKGTLDNVTCVIIFFQKPQAGSEDQVTSRAWSPSFCLDMEDWEAVVPSSIRSSIGPLESPANRRGRSGSAIGQMVESAARDLAKLQIDADNKDPDDLDSEAEYSDESSGDNYSDPEDSAQPERPVKDPNNKDDDDLDSEEDEEDESTVDALPDEWNVPRVTRLRNVSEAGMDHSIDASQVSTQSAMSAVADILLGSPMPKPSPLA